MRFILNFILDIVKFILKTIVVVIVLIVTINTLSILNTNTSSDTANLAQINLTEPIIDSSNIVEKIEKVMKNDNIKAVLLYIDSPGGSMSASYEISDAIKALNDKKPVVAYVSGTMASGSYLGGMHTSRILANKGAIIGSIGVIMQGFNIEKLAHKIGVYEQTVSAGEYKQAGTFMREWNDNEKKAMQSLADKSYELFVKEVADSRKLDVDNKDRWANARIFLAQEAKDLGLIDEISTYYGAKSYVEKISKVDNPSWQKEMLLDKFLNKLSTQLSQNILSFLSIKLI